MTTQQKTAQHKGFGRKRLCPTPPAQCNGGTLDAGPGKGRRKVHGDHREVLRCMQQHLVRQGYERLSSREFKSPVDSEHRGYILMLDKKPGVLVRTGKVGRTMTDAHTVMSW